MASLKFYTDINFCLMFAIFSLDLSNTNFEIKFEIFWVLHCSSWYTVATYTLSLKTVADSLILPFQFFDYKGIVQSQKIFRRGTDRC